LQAVFIGHNKQKPWSILDNHFEEVFKPNLGFEITKSEFESALLKHKEIQKNNERITN
jgi:hypothetical protein